MSLAVFNINDAGIQVAVDGDLIRTSPGYAVLDGTNLMIGEQASRNARLLPRWTNNRFWSQLTTNPLPNNTDQIRHHADLAFAHLEDLWMPLKKEADGVVFAVPGYYSGENLGLLLGMAKECGLPVTGIVDQSILAACNLPLRPNVLHLDIHLHSITLTRISNVGMLVRKDVKTILETGLFTLWDRWANIIATQFIQSTRFDPMHDASSEQQMFDILPDWIRDLQDTSMHSFQLSFGDTEHSVAISNDSLLKACTPLYPQIVQAIRSEIPAGDSASLLISHHFKGFPGLRESLGLISNVDIIDLNELKSIGSAHLHKDEIVTTNGSINHILQINGGETAGDDLPTTANRPTHLLWNHTATAIGSGFKLDANLDAGPRRSEQPVCTIYSRNGRLLLEYHGPENILVNNKSIDRLVELAAGDSLDIAGERLTMISVTGNG